MTSPEIRARLRALLAEVPGLEAEAEKAAAELTELELALEAMDYLRWRTDDHPPRGGETAELLAQLLEARARNRAACAALETHRRRAAMLRRRAAGPEAA